MYQIIKTGIFLLFAALLSVSSPFLSVVFADDPDNVNMAEDLNGSYKPIALSLDAFGGSVFSQTTAPSDYDLGFFGYLEWRFMSFMSLGPEAGYGIFPGTPGFQAGWVGLGGRVYPTTPTSLGEFYMEGSLDRILTHTGGLPPSNTYVGHWHGNLGLGYRFNIVQGVGLDLGAEYDGFSPSVNILSSIGVKGGLTFLFGDAQKVPTYTMSHAPLIPSTYTWQEGDTLKSVAVRLYGDSTLYALLAKANKAAILAGQLRPGYVMRVPPLPSGDTNLELIREASRTDPTMLKLEKMTEMQVHSDIHQPRVDSYIWRKGDNLRKVALRLYGNEDIYPLLVDANEDDLIHPANLAPGVELIVPSLPDLDQLDVVIQKAWDDPHYLEWANGQAGVDTGDLDISEVQDENATEPGTTDMGNVVHAASVTTYVWQQGDDLRSVAKDLYGDEDLYPLLVDANSGTLVDPSALVAGTAIQVPAIPSKDQLDAIRNKAWDDPHYLSWENGTP